MSALTLPSPDAKVADKRWQPDPEKPTKPNTN
jgi:hypothetical protein